MPEFPQLTKAIQDGIDRNMHTGVQVYVSVNDDCVLDYGFGMATADQPVTPSTLMLWRSAGKPITAAAICQRLQQGVLNLDAPVGTYLPDATSTVVEQITIRQILTHTSGLPLIDTGWPHDSWDAIIERIRNIDQLRLAAAYQPQSSWFLLGEILRQTDHNGRSLHRILHDDLLQPLEMNDVQCGLTDVEAASQRLPELYTRQAGKLVANEYSGGRWLTEASPGGNFRGPIKALGRFYEMLLRSGQTSNGTPLLNKETVQQMVAPHRVGEFDETFQHIVDFGLGVIADSNKYGAATVPYGFGANCAPSTFGHGGAQCAMGFCDPERKLVVAWAANGFCGEGQHQRRNLAINNAIYQDLGLTD